MRCKVDGCDRDAMYRGLQLCQMHYFRNMRNGRFDILEKTKKYRAVNPAGYQKILEPDFWLADVNGYVYEHRYVFYNEVNSSPESCSICGKSITWETLHIDHIDRDVTNNNKENLRALCRGCNTSRDRTCESYNPSNLFTVNGVTKTAGGWEKTDGVNVTGATIKRRKRLGASDYECVYGEKKTHKGS